MIRLKGDDMELPRLTKLDETVAFGSGGVQHILGSVAVLSLKTDDTPPPADIRVDTSDDLAADPPPATRTCPPAVACARAPPSAGDATLFDRVCRAGATLNPFPTITEISLSWRSGRTRADVILCGCEFSRAGHGAEPARGRCLPWAWPRAGVFRCGCCGRPLFNASAAFDAGTGWPAFRAALPAAVCEIPVGGATHTLRSRAGPQRSPQALGRGGCRTGRRPGGRPAPSAGFTSAPSSRPATSASTGSVSTAPPDALHQSIPVLTLH